VGDATRQVDSWISTLQQMHTLQQENEDLKNQIAQLQLDNSNLQDLRAENERLQRMLKFQTEFPALTQQPAKVIGYDTTGLSQMLVIDQGSNKGIAERMAVVSPGGNLVGTIRDVTPDRANVLLVTDVDSSISVVISSNNNPGVVQGQAQRGGRLLVQHIPQGADIGKGDLIKTSGAGGFIPRGLLVGQISEVHQRDVEMEQEADAYPLSELELDSLEEVLVITSGGDSGDTPAIVPATTPTTTITPTLTLTATLTPGSQP
jgi:rod shape-determining protein MreC